MPPEQPDENQANDQEQQPTEVVTPEVTENTEAQPEAVSETPEQPSVISPDSQATPLPSVVTDAPKKRKFRLPKPESILPRALRNKLGKAARPVSIILIVVILGLAGFLGWHFTNRSSTDLSAVARFQDLTPAFAVLSTTPSDNQTNVVPTTAITIQFSQPVNPQKLLGNLFLTPSVAGKYTQGKNSSEIVFTPNTPFAEGTDVQVMLNGTFQSKQGSQLGANVMYSFTTSLPPGQVLFQDSNGLLATVSSAENGQQQSYSLTFGNQVADQVNVTLYKGTMDGLLQSLVYKNDGTTGQPDPEFLDNPIETSGLQSVSSQTGLKNGSNFNVKESSGIYLAVVTDQKGNQLGHVWVVYSDFGVLARQDDQKMILDAQDLSSSTEVPATVQLYNLEGNVDQVSQASISGLTTLQTPYSQPIDVVVASDGTSQALIPVSILESEGDIRVDQDLSTAQTTYGVTDKPTYAASDTVKYSGFVRANQDAVYGPLAASTLHLYVAQFPGGTPLTSFSASVDSNGMFSGSFPVSSSWLNGDTSDQFQIYATSPDGNSAHDSQVASFAISSEAQSSSTVSVNFAKSSYLPTDTVQATIKAVDANGNPIANATVSVHTFSEDYYENNPTANLEDFGDPGSEVSGSPTSVQLNSNGQATFNVKVSSLVGDGTSQLVTVQAGIQGATGAGSEGGDSTIVHQGNGTLNFGISKDVINPGDQLIGRVYANTLSGSAIAGTEVSYQLIDQSTQSPTTVSSGNVTTDSNGYAQISTNVPSSVQAGDVIKLKAWISDSGNNQIDATTYYYVTAPSEAGDTSGAALQDLDISGSSGNVSVGQQVNLNINSPFAVNAMVTMDRGRIYSSQMVKLAQGNNSFSFNVSADLAPSFTLTINYFENGIYHSEGAQFIVANPTKSSVVQLSDASGQSVSANAATTVQVNAKNSSGNPLQTNLIVSVVSANAYNLYGTAAPDIFTSLYPTLPIMTSSSSSLSPIATGGGGRCGGGGGDSDEPTNPFGTTLLWQPEISTNSSGQANITFTPPKGSWIVNVYSMDGNTAVGSASTTITAN